MAKARAMLRDAVARGGTGEVASGLEEILDDIRELSRGILGDRAPLPVDVAVRISGRPAERIEIAVYYVVAEALTNVAKHAQASRAVGSAVKAASRTASEI